MSVQYILIAKHSTIAGLDVASRSLLTSLLATLHLTQSPSVLYVLRPQDALPPNITHLALVGGETLGDVTFGTKDEIIKLMGPSIEKVKRIKRSINSGIYSHIGEVLVDLKNLGVTYGDRTVLKDITWRIQEGQKWVLRGHNGSGKSTLLSLVLGDHPSSFTFGEDNIQLFGKPRIKQATTLSQLLLSHIGIIC